MKTIINGKLYNTETAKFLGANRSVGKCRNDFNYWEQSLYLKKTGEYFLYSYGGYFTFNGEKIKPQTEDEAKEWAMDNISADEYIEIFGEVEE